MHQILPRHRQYTNRHTQYPHNNTTIILTLLGILSMGTPLRIRCGELLLDSGKGSGLNSWTVYGQKFPRLIGMYRDHSVMKFELYILVFYFIAVFVSWFVEFFALYHSLFFGKAVFTLLTIQSHTLSKSHFTEK